MDASRIWMARKVRCRKWCSTEAGSLGITLGERADLGPLLFEVMRSLVRRVVCLEGVSDDSADLVGRGCHCHRCSKELGDNVHSR